MLPASQRARLIDSCPIMELVPNVSGTLNLQYILDRLLDRGQVIAGDVRVSLASFELLTNRPRLRVYAMDKPEARVLVASIDTNLKHADAVSPVALASRSQSAEETEPAGVVETLRVTRTPARRAVRR